MRSPSKQRVKELGEEQAREKCLRLLARRAHAAAELSEKLRHSGFAPEVTERTLLGLTESGLVDDEEFARSWVAERHRAGGSGRRKLAWELGRKGIGRETIERVLAEEVSDEAELEQAAGLARRKAGGIAAGPARAARVRRFLLGRGYGFEVVDKALQSLPAATDDAGETSDMRRGEER